MSAREVLLFAGLRELARSDRLVVVLDDGATVADLRREIARTHPAIASRLGPCRIAVAHEFVGDDRVIAPGEEIALVPPVSGGNDGARVRISDTALRIDDLVAAVSHRGAGGIAIFVGNVRDRSQGKSIVRLDYEAYGEMALAAMRRITDAIEREIEGSRVAIHHRVGSLVPGETAVVVAASAPHRAEAFAACRAAIEALKQDVPIWKKELDEDGACWVGWGP
jgi:molybdopterin synthase catalytic subunit